MIVVASQGGEVGIEAAVEVLRRGGTALDAVEAATRLVEADPTNYTVGVGGLPNLLGEVELDASIMDGRTLATGAVGALRGFRHPISVARRVMEELPHVLLVGEGAARFAREVGAEEVELPTPQARERWEQWLEENVPDELRRSWPPRELAPWARLTARPRLPRGTVNVLAQDGAGHLAVAVSTSGWAMKYPGRLGDSPIVGAGNYCDDRYGAAACTGVGEWTIRCGTARAIVLYMKLGYTVEAACEEAVRDLGYLDRGEVQGGVNILALDRTGKPWAVTTREKPAPYVLWQEGMAAPEKREALRIAID
jgi:isoaspartyl peptidase/L-asparaginase-like protein (Ntn-hydrolase superfamily)